MKKELFAAALLALIAAAAILNAGKVESITEAITKEIEKAEKSAEQADWETCMAQINSAGQKWEREGPYLRSVMSHPQEEAIIDSFYDLKLTAEEQDQGKIRISAARLKARLKAISEMEKIKVETIF